MSIGNDNNIDDLAWIDTMDKEDEIYKKFYPVPLDSINIIQMLMTPSGEQCLSASQSVLSLQKPGFLPSSEVIQIINCQTKLGFKPFAVLKYAIELDVDEVPKFLSDKLDVNWMRPVSYTQDHTFKDCSPILNKVASLVILYKQGIPAPNKPLNMNKTRSTRSNGGFSRRDQRRDGPYQHRQQQSSNRSRHSNKRSTRKKVLVWDPSL
jgi:hypothetical protein